MSDATRPGWKRFALKDGPGIAVGRAEPCHLPQLGAVEMAAATLFPPGTIPDHIRSDRMPEGVLREAMDEGLLWVAVNETDIPVGFALLRYVDGLALLAELDVLPAYGRRGIGRALMAAAAQEARAAGYARLFLTTFTHVPWNAPFYARLGFAVLTAEETPAFLHETLTQEGARGLEHRVAMGLIL